MPVMLVTNVHPDVIKANRPWGCNKNSAKSLALRGQIVVKSLLKAPPPGANNNEVQQREVVLMKNKYDGGGGEGLNVCV